MVLTCSIVHPSLHFIGGAERLMVDLAVGLADEGCVVEVVAGLCHKYWLDYIQQNGERVKVKVLGYKVPGNLLFWLNVRGFVKALARLISSECDAVITSSFPASLVGDVFRMRNKALILHYLHEAPMVLHDREGVMALSSELRLFYRFVSCFYRKFDLEAVCRSSRIIANSCFTRRVNAAVYGVAESGISVIYPGVDVMRLRGCVHELRFIGKYRRAGVPIIFFPRGVQSWRNSQVCVQALSRLRVGEFVGVFTGGSRYEAAALFKYARRIGVDQKLLWLGELADSDLFSLYS
ncbi:MAG: glycosyltransferase, partial [Candidatus Bathyarchaeia archaeon]